jgi:hypothetical protein
MTSGQALPRRSIHLQVQAVHNLADGLREPSRTCPKKNCGFTVTTRWQSREHRMLPIMTLPSLLIQTGSQQPGFPRPSIGSWVSYGLGSEKAPAPPLLSFYFASQRMNIDQPLVLAPLSSGSAPITRASSFSCPAGDPSALFVRTSGRIGANRRAGTTLYVKLNHIEGNLWRPRAIETLLASPSMKWRAIAGCKHPFPS